MEKKEFAKNMTRTYIGIFRKTKAFSEPWDPKEPAYLLSIYTDVHIYLSRSLLFNTEQVQRQSVGYP